MTTPKKFRIPRVAAFTLMLGMGCNDDGEGGQSGGPDSGTESGNNANKAIDVGEARRSALARQVCAKAFECDPGGAKADYGSLDDCRTLNEQYWADDVQSYDEGCFDAMLDTYECYATAQCGNEAACRNLVARVDQLCDE